MCPVTRISANYWNIIIPLACCMCLLQSLIWLFLEYSSHVTQVQGCGQWPSTQFVKMTAVYLLHTDCHYYCLSLISSALASVDSHFWQPQHNGQTHRYIAIALHTQQTLGNYSAQVVNTWGYVLSYLFHNNQEHNCHISIDTHIILLSHSWQLWQVDVANNIMYHVIISCTVIGYLYNPCETTKGQCSQAIVSLGRFNFCGRLLLISNSPFQIVWQQTFDTVP